MAVFDKFLPPEPIPFDGDVEEPQPTDGGTNLADIILDKIAAQEALSERRPVVSDEEINEDNLDMHPKVIEVYTT